MEHEFGEQTSLSGTVCSSARPSGPDADRDVLITHVLLRLPDPFDEGLLRRVGG